MAKPTIRFKGYTDDWEQRKLGDVFKEYSEKNHTELPALTIIQGGGTVKREDSDRNLMYDKSNLSNYKMVRKDDFIVHLRSFEGGLEKASSDGIISPAYHTFHSDVADSRFYYPYFRSHEFIKHKLVPHVYGIRDGRSIDIDGMKTIEIPYTSTEEQQKIGDYLESIDHHITLHQRITPYFLKINAFVWEQRKLGDLVDRVTRKNQDLVSELPLTISAQYGLIDQNEFFDKRVASKDVSGYYLIENGEFAYNKSTSTDAPWGAIKRLDRYENGVLSTLYIVFGIKANNPIDSDFLVSYYSTNLWHKGIHEIAAEGARNHGLLNIAPADFFETKLMIPQDIEEQKKIGKYFEELERLITLHQRKCEETKILKKYMLQKMFPQNGQKVPEIRFKGFTDDWEQRKLGDVLERRIEQRQQSEEYPRLAFASGQGVIPLSERKTNNREQLTKDEYTKKYLVTELNDIVYNPANVKYGAIDRNKCGRGLISPIYVTFTTNEIPGFIERIVTSHDFQQRALRFEEGTVTKRQSVNPEDLVTLDILVAPKREEQQKIATYFDSLDHLITLHQRKCEELQNIKKFMLQNMFV